MGGGQRREQQPGHAIGCGLEWGGGRWWGGGRGGERGGEGRGRGGGGRVEEGGGGGGEVGGEGGGGEDGGSVDGRAVDGGGGGRIVALVLVLLEVDVPGEVAGDGRQEDAGRGDPKGAVPIFYVKFIQNKVCFRFV